MAHFLGGGTSGIQFISCVQLAIFGFFSANENADYNHPIPTPNQNYFNGTKKELHKYLVNNFTLPQATVLDMMNLKVYIICIYMCSASYCLQFFSIGALSQATIQCGRHTICVTKSNLSESLQPYRVTLCVTIL